MYIYVFICLLYCRRYMFILLILVLFHLQKDIYIYMFDESPQKGHGSGRRRVVYLGSFLFGIYVSQKIVKLLVHYLSIYCIYLSIYLPIYLSNLSFHRSLHFKNLFFYQSIHLSPYLTYIHVIHVNIHPYPYVTSSMASLDATSTPPKDTGVSQSMVPVAYQGKFWGNLQVNDVQVVLLETSNQRCSSPKWCVFFVFVKVFLIFVGRHLQALQDIVCIWFVYFHMY